MSDNDKPLAEFDGNGGYHAKVYAGDKEGEYKLVAYVSDDPQRWPAASIIMTPSGSDELLSKGEAIARANIGIINNVEREFGTAKQGREGREIVLTVDNIPAKSPKELLDKALSVMDIGVEIERAAGQREFDMQAREAGGRSSTKSKTIAPEDMEVVGSATERLRKSRMSNTDGGSRGVS
jgi:hypothetical protein